MTTASPDHRLRPRPGRAAALAETGGGRITDTEVGDEDSYYEVEVTLDDGSQVDVQLDEGFNVVGGETDGAGEDDGPGDDWPTPRCPRRPGVRSRGHVLDSAGEQ